MPLKSLLGYCNKYEKNCCFFISFSFYPSFELTPKMTRETHFFLKSFSIFMTLNSNFNDYPLPPICIESTCKKVLHFFVYILIVY